MSASSRARPSSVISPFHRRRASGDESVERRPGVRQRLAERSPKRCRLRASPERGRFTRSATRLSMPRPMAPGMPTQALHQGARMPYQGCLGGRKRARRARRRLIQARRCARSKRAQPSCGLRPRVSSRVKPCLTSLAGTYASRLAEESRASGTYRRRTMKQVVATLGCARAGIASAVTRRPSASHADV
jgi:hypothetical protein